MNFKKIKKAIIKINFKMASKKLKFAEKKKEECFKQLEKAQLIEKQAYENFLKVIEVKS